jgi:hypothetical protein
MKNLLLLSACYLAVSSQAYHPFVGEHAGKTQVDHGSGNISLKMEQKPSTKDNYKHLSVHHEDFGPSFTLFERLVGGAVDQHEAFRTQLNQHLDTNKRLKNGHLRLG